MNPTEHSHAGPPAAVASRNFLVVLALLFGPAIACSLNPQPFPPENDVTGGIDAGDRGHDSSTGPGVADAGTNDSADAAAVAPDGGGAFGSDGSVDGSLETPDGASDAATDGAADGASDAATDAGPSDASVRD
jgi:hypothetical protein